MSREGIPFFRSGFPAPGELVYSIVQASAQTIVIHFDPVHRDN